MNKRVQTKRKIVTYKVEIIAHLALVPRTTYFSLAMIASNPGMQRLDGRLRISGLDKGSRNGNVARIIRSLLFGNSCFK